MGFNWDSHEFLGVIIMTGVACATGPSVNMTLAIELNCNLILNFNGKNYSKFNIFPDLRSKY
jgi:hypothetical protein